MRSKPSLSRRRSLSDPLSKALQPPPDESPEARDRRLKREADAKKVSDDIDEQIKQDKAALKKQKQAVKILLLGQSESGKSTTLKQFQLLHSPQAFSAERFAWRTVIYLNLIRSIRRILEALLPPQPADSPISGLVSPTSAISLSHSLSLDSSRTAAYEVEGETYRRSADRERERDRDRDRERSGGVHTSKLEKYAKQLAPLLELEQKLMRQLSFPDEDDPNTNSNGSTSPNGYGFSVQPRPWNSTAPPLPIMSPPTPGRAFTNISPPGYNTAPLNFNGSLSSSPLPGVSTHPIPPISYASTLTHSKSLQLSNKSSSSHLALGISPSASLPTTPTTYTSPTSTTLSSPLPELALPPTSTWKKSLSLSTRLLSTRAQPKNKDTGEISGWWEDPDDPVHVIYKLAHVEWGMCALWRDPEVRDGLRRRRVRMEESSGFYLNEIERIAAHRYIPTDEDVLKARLKTIGVVEHTFTVKSNVSSSTYPSYHSSGGGGNSGNGTEWKIYDVGGARNQRQAWAPYFEDVNAIIFLAPISAFDQTLAEDSRVNRLEDSMLLWRSLVSNKLLSEVNIILFLNKCDLLKAKLEAGVSLEYHMPSYGNRSNDYETVSKYFRNKFGALHQSHTPNKDRELYIHLTSVTDKLKTSIIISNVRDIILRHNLQTSRLI